MRQEVHLPFAAEPDDYEGNQAVCLRVALLGPPIVSWAGQVWPISRRQVRALLYRLSTDLQPIPREQLCFLFWPDDPHSSARRNLTHLLTHLRLALPKPDLLEITNEYAVLDARRTWSDTVAFDQLFPTRLERHPVALDEDGGYNPLVEAREKALLSYRGSFLSGFYLPDCNEYESWVSREREAYKCRYLEALVEMIDFHQEGKSIETAIQYANRYLEIDNLAEDVHCKLIELYAETGNRSAAERQFEICAAALEQELGISPSPKTWAVYQSISNTRLPGVLLPSPWPMDKSLPRLETPFVGREEILKQLDQAYNLASLGRGKVFLISGDPGIGKTRLLQQVASHYHRTATVLFSTCNPGMGDLPYHPLAEAFRSALESHSSTLKTSPLWLTEAGRLLPEVYSHYPNLPTPLPARPEEARRRLFEALYQLALGLSGRSRPVILCLDDLHWADSSTLEWLIYLGNRLVIEGLSHILVLAAFRCEEAPCLVELQFALHRLGVLEERTLDGLEVDHYQQILQHFLGNNENLAQLATRLHQISAGNPFYLQEILRALIESRGVPRKLSDLENISVPKTIQEAVRKRLTWLSSDERKILEFAATLRRPCSLEMVQQAFEGNELEILESLEAMQARHLLSEQDGRYDFPHELVRMAIYEDLSYDRRRFIHRLCGKTMEKMSPDEIALLAWHFEQGGEPGKAADYAFQVGENASRVFAFSEALDFFSRALVLLKQQATALKSPQDVEANYRKQVLALSRRGYVFRSLGDMQAYENDFEEEGRLARLLGDENIIAHVHLREANAHRWFCRYMQAQRCAQEALRMSRKIKNKGLEARALRELGLAARAIGDFTAAEDHLQEALKRFRELKEPGYEIHTLCNLATLYTYRREFRKAEELAYDALGRCEQAQLPYHRRIVLSDLGATLEASGQLEQGRECLISGLDLAREIADRTQEIFCLCHLGWLENRAGRPDEALGYLRDGLALTERLDSRSEQSRLYAGLSEAHRLLGNTRLAKAFAIKALDLAKKHGRLYDLRLAEHVFASLEGGL